MIRVLVLGYGPMGLALARGVLACPDIASLAGAYPWSCHPQEYNLWQEAAENAFRLFLKDHGIPLVEARGVNHYQFSQALARLRPDVVLVGSWGEIFRRHVLETPEVQFINCHPSLLPRHRGANPYVGAILAGESHTGVTFHRLDTGIDTGPVLLQEALPIDSQETGESLRQRCASLAEVMVPKLLHRLAAGTLTETPQNEAEASYDKMTPALGWIAWHEAPEDIERKIRALYPWFENLALLGQTQVGFHFGRLVSPPQETGGVVTAAGQPGCILSRIREGVVVTTVRPDTCLLLTRPRFFHLPEVLEGLLAGLLLRPGRCFTPYTSTEPYPRQG